MIRTYIYIYITLCILFWLKGFHRAFLKMLHCRSDVYTRCNNFFNRCYIFIYGKCWNIYFVFSRPITLEYLEVLCTGNHTWFTDTSKHSHVFFSCYHIRVQSLLHVYGAHRTLFHLSFLTHICLHFLRMNCFQLKVALG